VVWSSSISSWRANRPLPLFSRPSASSSKAFEMTSISLSLFTTLSASSFKGYTVVLISFSFAVASSSKCTSRISLYFWAWSRLACTCSANSGFSLPGAAGLLRGLTAFSFSMTWFTLSSSFFRSSCSVSIAPSTFSKVSSHWSMTAFLALYFSLSSGIAFSYKSSSLSAT